MQCLYPIKIARKKDGRKYVGSDGYDYDVVPCGRCLACRKERSKSWSLRLMMESLYWKDSCFITLTYDDLHIPLVRNGDYINATLDKSDLQRFWKRLRKDLSEQGRYIKYYAVGEYGDTTFRPHYHAIVFGISAFDRDLLEENWSKGLVDIKSVEMASCNYVAGYVQKKLYGDVAVDVYGTRVPPFSLMSKGIGKAYLEDHIEEMLNDGYIFYRGSKLPISRYYWDLMKKDGYTLQVACKKGSIKKSAIEKSMRELSRYGISREMEEMHEWNRTNARARALEKIAEITRRNKI